MPAFAVVLDHPVEVPSLGTVLVDIAYGGMFDAIADATQFGLRITPDGCADITCITETIKAAAAEQIPVTHPDNAGSPGGLRASGDAHLVCATAHARNRTLHSVAAQNDARLARPGPEVEAVAWVIPAGQPNHSRSG